jgi:hypothetical protein
MADGSDSDSDVSSFSSEGEQEDVIAKARRERRAYRPKAYRSRGVISPEWIVCRDALKKSDASGYAKLAALLRKGSKDEPLHGSWGGRTLLHWAAWYGCTNCVKRLLLDGANPTRTDSKGMLPMSLARKNGKDATALIIEFWDSPTTNHKIEGGPNFDFDPRAAADQAEKAVHAKAREIERKKVADKAAENAHPDAALAAKLGVVVVNKKPPKTSKQPNQPAKRESLGALEDPANAMSEYAKFRAAEAAAEDA